MHCQYQQQGINRNYSQLFYYFIRIISLIVTLIMSSSKVAVADIEDQPTHSLARLQIASEGKEKVRELRKMENISNHDGSQPFVEAVEPKDGAIGPKEDGSSVDSECKEDLSFIENTIPWHLSDELSLDLSDCKKPQHPNIGTKQLNESGLKSDSDPKAITLLSENLMGQESQSTSSRLSQYSENVDDQSYASFMNLCESSYEVLIKSFKLLFQNVSCLFSQRARTVEHTYLKYLHTKSQQVRISASSSNYSEVGIANNEIYMDCQTVAQQICHKLEATAHKNQNYSHQVLSCYHKLQSVIETATAERQQRQQSIRDLLARLNAISDEMVALMIPQRRKQSKKQIPRTIFLDSYIRKKYLVAKQKSYLDLLAQILHEVLRYVSFLCLESQPKLCLAVKEALLGYVEASKRWNEQYFANTSALVQRLQKTNPFETVYGEVVKMLNLCIPQSLQSQEQSQTSDQTASTKLHKLIESLIRESQSLVYLPCLQIDSHDYAYSTKNRALVQWNTDRNGDCCEVVLVLTTEGHLIIEIEGGQHEGDQMALLHLNQIKISRKDDSLVLIDKVKGVVGYLISSNAVFGYLVLSPPADSNINKSAEMQKDKQELINQFMSKVKDVKTASQAFRRRNSRN